MIRLFYIFFIVTALGHFGSVLYAGPTLPVPVIIDGTSSQTLLTPHDRKILADANIYPLNANEVPILSRALPLFQNLVNSLLIHEKGTVPRAVVITDSLIPDAVMIPASMGGPIIAISVGWLGLIETGDQLATTIAHETKHENSKLQEEIDKLKTGSFQDKILGLFLKRSTENEVDFTGSIDLVNRAGRSPYSGFELFNLLYIKYGDIGGTAHTKLSSRADSLATLLTASKRQYGIRLVETSDPHDPINAILLQTRNTIRSPQFLDMRLAEDASFVQSYKEYLEAGFKKVGSVSLSEQHSVSNYIWAIDQIFNDAATQEWQRVLSIAGGDLSPMQLTQLHSKFRQSIEIAYRELLRSHHQEIDRKGSFQTKDVLENIALLQVRFEDQLPGISELHNQIDQNENEFSTLTEKITRGDINPIEVARTQARLREISRRMPFDQQMLFLSQERAQQRQSQYKIASEQANRRTGIFLKGKVHTLFNVDPKDLGKVRDYLLSSYDKLFSSNADANNFLEEYLSSARLALTSGSYKDKAEAAKRIVEEWFSQSQIQGDYSSLANWLGRHEAQIPSCVSRVAQLLGDAYKISSKGLYINVRSKTGEIYPISLHGEIGQRLFDQSGIALAALKDKFRDVQVKQRSAQGPNTRFVSAQGEQLISFADALIKNSNNTEFRNQVEGLKTRVRTWALQQGPQQYVKSAALAGSQITGKQGKLLMALRDPFWSQDVNTAKLLSDLVQNQSMVQLKSQYEGVPIGHLDNILNWANPSKLHQEIRSLGGAIQMGSPQDESNEHYWSMCDKMVEPIQWLLGQGPQERGTALYLLNQVLRTARDEYSRNDRMEKRYQELFVDSVSHDLEVMKQQGLPLQQIISTFLDKQLDKRNWDHKAFYSALQNVFLKTGSSAERLKNWIELSRFASEYNWKIILDLRRGQKDGEKFMADATPDTLQSWFGPSDAVQILVDDKESKTVDVSLKVQALVRFLSYRKKSYGEDVSQNDLEFIFDQVWRDTANHTTLRIPLLAADYVQKLTYPSSQAKLAQWQLDHTFNLSANEAGLKSGKVSPPTNGHTRSEIENILKMIEKQFPEKTAARQEVLETVARKTMANREELRKIQTLKITKENFSSVREVALADAVQMRLGSLKNAADHFSIIRYFIGLEDSIPEHVLHELNLYPERCAEFRRKFQDSNIFMRTYFLTTLLDSGTGALSSQSVENKIFDIILGDRKQNEVLRAIIEDYFASVHPSEKEVLIGRILASIVDSKGGKVSIAKVFEAMGPLGIKAAQFLRRSGLLDATLNKELDSVFDHALEPDRVEVVDLVHKAFSQHPENLVAIMEVMNSGSLGVAVHILVRHPKTGKILSVVARILKPHSENLVAFESEAWEKTEIRLMNRKGSQFLRAGHLIGEMRKHSMKTLGPGGSQLHYSIERELVKKAAKVYDSPPDSETGYRIRTLQPIDDLMEHVDPNMRDSFLLYPKIDHVSLSAIDSLPLREKLALKVISSESHAVKIGKFDPDNNPGNWLINPSNKELIRIDCPEFVELNQSQVEASSAFLHELLDPIPGRSVVRILEKYGTQLFVVRTKVRFSWADVLMNLKGIPPSTQPHERVYWIRNALENYLLVRDSGATVEINDDFRTQLASLSGIPIWGEAVRPELTGKTLLKEFNYSTLMWKVKQDVIRPLAESCSILLGKISRKR